MKSHTRYLTMNVPARMEMVNITPEVEAEVRASGIHEGLCLVNAMHITRVPSGTTTTAPAKTTPTRITSDRSWAGK
jgi:hypothetical protein